MRVLVTGSNGQLGSELRRLSKGQRFGNCLFLFADVNILDICNRAEVNAFLNANRVNVVINCAAYTAVDKAENDIETAFHVNRDGVSLLSECCVENNAALIHISTDYVFDGKGNRPLREDDPVSPIGVYGLSKLSGEEAMVEKGVRGIIIRTSWLYSAFGNNFVKTMLRIGTEKSEVHVVADQIGSPTWASDLAKAILEIVVTADFSKWKGVEVFHYSNEGECSWYEFASAVMEMSGKKCQVLPISTQEYPTLCQRPAYSVLDKTKIKERFGLEIPMWDDSLKLMLEDLRKIQ